MLGLDMRITIDKEEFIAFEGAKLNYSSRQFDEELFFYATPLLFERRIKQQRIKMSSYKDIPIFFISKNNSDLPFDPFAASFYLISRYEEYLTTTTDQHDRYQAENSLAYQNDFLHLPVVDIWVQLLEKELEKRYKNLPIKKRKYTFIPTYDIDLAFAYKNKGILRNLGGYFVDLKRRNMDNMLQRFKVQIGQAVDPYDTFDWQIALHNKHNLKPIYFFLVGDYGQYDKNISILNLNYQRLIQSTGDFYEVGIHPSYESNNKLHKLPDEIKNLSGVLKKQMEKSRQHFIKLKLPDTYQNLIELDVRADYTMGYPSQIGFRAGTASSFAFYDISLEIKTTLRVYPFMVMDVTLQQYLNLHPQKALEQVKGIIEQVKSVNGLFISLWHNHSLSNVHGWEGWRDMYEEMVSLALP